MSYKKLVWQLMPKASHRFIRDVYFTFRLAPNYLYDFRRYLRYSGINKGHELRAEQAAQVTMAYHQLEKGLSLAEPRPGFGKEVVSRLFAALDRFLPAHGMISPATEAIGVLRAYIRFNEGVAIDMATVKDRLRTLLASVAADQALIENCVGGTRDVTRQWVDTQRQAGFAGLMESRSSVRQFAGGEIPEAHLQEAVRIAQRTPSVCNRQAWRVHVFTQPEDRARVFEIQKGSRGFGEKASLALMITCDLACFVDAGERYQAWIDGGMFSMSLSLAFHAMGYGTCCLAWSKEKDDDLAIRKATGLAPHEQVIMLMAIGTLPEKFRVACSVRRALGDVLVVH